jgi:putative type II/III system pilus formation protein
MRAYKPFLLRSAMLALTLSTSCAAMARAEELCAGTAEEKKPIELTAGHVKFFTFAQSFERLAIGNRAILGVQPAGSNVAILLTGLAVGETNLLAIDRFNKKICSAIVRVAWDAEDVGKVVVLRGPFVGRRGPSEKSILPSGTIVDTGSDKGFTHTTIRCAPTCIEVDDSLQNNSIKRSAPWPGVPGDKPGEEEKPIEQTSREQASR